MKHGMKGKGKKRVKDPDAGPSDRSTVYRGPVHPRGWQENIRTSMVECVQLVTLASSAGGVINAVFDQTMTGLSGWTSLANIWDEFRVLKMVVEYVPANRYNRAATTTLPGFAVVDRDSNSAITAAATALGYESVRILGLDDPWLPSGQVMGTCYKPVSWAMNSVEDGIFLTSNVPTPTVKPNIKLYFNGLTASTTYGTALLRVLVQFRGKF